ncbi:MAG: SirB2 family protein [Burkholderiales bacterium]|nr:SirB2 family protein [Burkholderiales bacterium]
MPTTYALLKFLHVGCAVASIMFFCVRGVWMIGAPERLQRTWVRVVPHVVDTVLLASAIALAVMIRNYPGTHGWLTAKITGLVVYIVLGSIALKRGRTLRIRISALVGAIVVFGYIVSVAITKSPAGFLAWP